MGKVNEALQLPRRMRYRCFHQEGKPEIWCPAIATDHARDVNRHDASTFYCTQHRPTNAAPIADDGPFVVVQLAAILTLGATTLRRDDVRAPAIALAVQLLDQAGIRAEILGATAAWMVPGVPIIGQGEPDRVDAPASDA